MKILNLYAGIGGNRRLWKNVEVTAVEKDSEIAGIYQDFFPEDEVVVGDARKYLLENFKKFDFIWSSPPCPSHSKIRFMFAKANAEREVGFTKPIFPDMRLYEEILFLKYYFSGKFCVENVIGFYDPFLDPFVVGRHYFWTNFPILKMKVSSGNIREDSNSEMSAIKNRTVLRNCVNSKIAKMILECAFSKKHNLKGFVSS